MFDGWEVEVGDLVEWICCFINMVVVNWEKIRKFGCLVGMFCMEFVKVGYVVYGDVGKLFMLFCVWLWW